MALNLRRAAAENGMRIAGKKASWACLSMPFGRVYGLRAVAVPGSIRFLGRRTPSLDASHPARIQNIPASDNGPDCRTEFLRCGADRPKEENVHSFIRTRDAGLILR
jgi:hypothetical protein